MSYISRICFSIFLICCIVFLSNYSFASGSSQVEIHENNITNAISYLCSQVPLSSEIQSFLNSILPDKPNVAVIPDDEYFTESFEKLTLLFIEELMSLEILLTIDPSRLDKIFEEKRLYKLGITEKSKINEIGKLAQADAFFFYSIIDQENYIEIIIRFTDNKGTILFAKSYRMLNQDDSRVNAIFSSTNTSSTKFTLTGGWPTSLGFTQVNGLGFPNFSVDASYFTYFNVASVNFRYYYQKSYTKEIESILEKNISRSVYLDEDWLKEEIVRSVRPKIHPYVQLGCDFTGWPRSLLPSPKIGVGISIPFTSSVNNHFYLDVGTCYYLGIGFRDPRTVNVGLTFIK